MFPSDHNHVLLNEQVSRCPGTYLPHGRVTLDNAFSAYQQLTALTMVNFRETASLPNSGQPYPWEGKPYCSWLDRDQ
jgi:hypothetical protein